MKRKQWLFCVLIGILLVTVSCGKGKYERKMDWVTENTNSRKEMANKVVERIAESIEEKNAESLMELFSTNALDEIGQEKLKKEIENLFEFFQGGDYCYEGNLSSHETNDYGVKTLTINAIYKITTDQAEYHIYFVFQPVNDLDETQLGLSHIIATTEENYQKDDFKWIHLDEVAGVYIINE